MNCPDTPYRTHLSRWLPALRAESRRMERQIERMRGTIDPLLLLDLERVREDLVRTLPERKGGKKPWDRVVLFRSFLLAVWLGEGRINGWVETLQDQPLLRVLIGISPDQAPPSVGAHYRLARAIVRTHDASGVHTTELSTGNRGLFERALTRPASDDEHGNEGACETMRRALDRLDPDRLPPTLDGLLIDWIVRVALRCAVDADALPEGALHVAIDGTVHKSHASPRRRPRGPEREAAQARTRDEGDTDAGSTDKTERDLRLLADSNATWRYSNGSRGLEFGHLGLTATTRVGRADIPLLSAFARPHEGEAPAALRAVEYFRHSLRRHLPKLRIASLTGDAAYDAVAAYRFATDRHIAPIFPLHPRRATADPTTPRAPDGCTPLCPGDLPMKRHCVTRHGSTTWICPAMRAFRDPQTRTLQREFDPQRCPLGQPCERHAHTPYLTLAHSDHPRINLPIPRGATAFTDRLKDRTAAERVFNLIHKYLPDHVYRRLHLWQLGSACVVFHLIARAAAKRRPPWLEDFWNQLQPA